MNILASSFVNMCLLLLSMSLARELNTPLQRVHQMCFHHQICKNQLKRRQEVYLSIAQFFWSTFSLSWLFSIEILETEVELVLLFQPNWLCIGPRWSAQPQLPTFFTPMKSFHSLLFTHSWVFKARGLLFMWTSQVVRCLFTRSTMMSWAEPDSFLKKRRAECAANVQCILCMCVVDSRVCF